MDQLTEARASCALDGETRVAGVIHFVVYGIAKAAGSKRGFVVGKRAVIVDANPNSRDWKNAVADAASQSHRGKLLDGPLWAHFRFFRPRPKSHYRSGKNSELLKPSAPQFPTMAPDVLKLSRAVEDAMKGIVYLDDSQIVRESLEKNWGSPARVEVTIQEII